MPEETIISVASFVEMAHCLQETRINVQQLEKEIAEHKRIYDILFRKVEKINTLIIYQLFTTVIALIGIIAVYLQR